MRIRLVRLIVLSSTKFNNRIRSTSLTNISSTKFDKDLFGKFKTNILIRQGSIIGFVRQVGIFVEFNRIISLQEKFDQVRLKLIELNRTYDFEKIVRIRQKFDYRT